MTHSLLIAVNHSALKIKIVITTAETAPGQIKEPGGTNCVTIPI